MSKNSKLELVSFDICPYVQRSVITLLHKQVDFKLTFIDLSSPPEWFDKYSPLGKVPLLLVREGAGEPVVLFESAVINEYLDEITPPLVLPANSLEKARQRAWIAVGGELLMNMFTYMTASDPADAKEAVADFCDTLGHVEKAVQGGSTFAKSGFGLVDAAFAPLFMRLLITRSFRDDPRWKSHPKTAFWSQALLSLPEVRESVTPDFKQKYVAYLKKMGLETAVEID